MSVSDEEARAAEYRSKIKARDATDRAATAALRGNPERRRQLGVAWEPVTNRDQPPEEHTVR